VSDRVSDSLMSRGSHCRTGGVRLKASTADAASHRTRLSSKQLQTTTASADQETTATPVCAATRQASLSGASL
jgi:hypothetical protein